MERIKRIYPSQHAHKWKCFFPPLPVIVFPLRFRCTTFWGGYLDFYLSTIPSSAAARETPISHFFVSRNLKNYRPKSTNTKLREGRQVGDRRREGTSREAWWKKDFLSEDSTVEAARIRKFEPRLCELEHFY